MILEHAPLAPSSAPVWGRCSGSVSASLAAPDLESERAREGTAAHWVGEQALNASMNCSNWLGEKAPNGVVVDEEMVEGAQVWVDDVMAVSAEHGAPHGLMVEHRVSMPQIHPDNWGTLDTAMWLPERNTLYIWDYKHGHREVDAAMNLQLVNYVAGLAEELALGPDCTVVMRVVQPFCYHSPSVIREWVTTLEDLRFWFNMLHKRAHEAMGPDALMSSGAHCRDCPAIARCRTARRSAYSVIDYAKEPYCIETLDGEDLAVERDILTVGMTALKARLGAIEDELHTRIQAGDTSSGLTLENKQGRLAWSAPVAQVLALGQQFGADLSKPAAITPTQATKAIPPTMRDAFQQVVQSVTTRPQTGMKLVKLEDSKTARAFSRS